MQIIRLIEKELFVNFLSASQVLTALPCRRNSQRNHRLFFKNWKKRNWRWIWMTRRVPQRRNLRPKWPPTSWRGRNCRTSSAPQSRGRPSGSSSPCRWTGRRSSLLALKSDWWPDVTWQWENPMKKNSLWMPFAVGWSGQLLASQFVVVGHFLKILMNFF